MTKSGFPLLMILWLLIPAWGEGHWQFRTTNYDKRLNTPGPKADIRGRFAGQGLTINSSFEDAEYRKCHTTFQAGWNWSRPSQILNPGSKIKFVVSTDASQENWPYPFGSANVWVDDAFKVVEFSRSKPAGPQAGEGTWEVPAGDPDGKTELKIGLYASHQGEMSIIHLYDWKTGAPKSQPATFSGSWRGSWRNSVGESGADSLDLKEDAQGNLSGTWTGSVIVSGRRKDGNRLQLSGRTATRDFQIEGVLQGNTLKLNYVARRLNASGSYQGESTFTR